MSTKIRILVVLLLLVIVGLAIWLFQGGQRRKRIQRAAHPVQYIDSLEQYIDRRSINPDIEVGEEEQLEYLRSLGYLK